MAKIGNDGDVNQKHCGEVWQLRFGVKVQIRGVIWDKMKSGKWKHTHFKCDQIGGSNDGNSLEIPIKEFNQYGKKIS